MSVSPETLIIVSPGFPANENDSTCLPAQQAFARTLSRTFPQVRLIILALQYPYTHDTYLWHDNLVIPFDGKKYGKVLRPLLWARVYRSLQKLTRNHRPIGILSLWCAETALIASYFARANKIRHCCWILGQDARKQNGLVRWIRPRAQDLIALSEFLQDEFHKNHRVRPAWVIPNGIDRTIFKRNSSNTREVDLLGIGSLIRLKRYDLFLRILAALKTDRPEIKAVLCGKGPQETVLKTLANHLKLDRNVEFVGEVPHRDALAFMQRSRILVHPSSYEGYSTVCLEALHSGCHVVSFTRAEKGEVPKWHVVDTPEQMVLELNRILQMQTAYESITIHDMEDSARAVMKLFS